MFINLYFEVRRIKKIKGTNTELMWEEQEDLELIRQFLQEGLEIKI